MKNQIENQITIVSSEGDQHTVLFKNGNVLVKVNENLLKKWLNDISET